MLRRKPSKWSASANGAAPRTRAVLPARAASRGASLVQAAGNRVAVLDTCPQSIPPAFGCPLTKIGTLSSSDLLGKTCLPSLPEPLSSCQFLRSGEPLLTAKALLRLLHYSVRENPVPSHCWRHASQIHTGLPVDVAMRGCSNTVLPMSFSAPRKNV